ncbi:MAG: SGNH/GDSL hydrolase family protein [Syntrophales bacterium]|nr:SGNH/GDSL hydrolase family protein [Syntrophales bacterium]
MIRPLKTIAKLKSGAPVVIAALGDSLTAGWMARKGYLDFLEEMFAERFPGSACKIHGSGIPGDTADFGLYRVEHDVIDFQPDCVFIQYAINDASYGFTEKQFEGNIRGIIDKIRAQSDADIVLVTSSFIGEGGENSFVEPYYQILEALGREYGLPVARVHAYWKEKIDEGVDFLSLVQYDHVHPTVAGYRLMAEAIMQLFQEEA